MHALKYQTFGQLDILSICYQKKRYSSINKYQKKIATKLL
jgi:hypothetical protein